LTNRTCEEVEKERSIQVRKFRFVHLEGDAGFCLVVAPPSAEKRPDRGQNNILLKKAKEREMATHCMYQFVGSFIASTRRIGKSTVVNKKGRRTLLQCGCQSFNAKTQKADDLEKKGGDLTAKEHDARRL
jgi:hypothetical protein